MNDLLGVDRAWFLLWTTVVLLVTTGVAVWLSGRAELRRRWSTWVLIAPVVGIPIWLGRGPTAVLAAVLGVLAVHEYARLVRLPVSDRHVLTALAVVFPMAGWVAPNLLALTPLIALGCALPALLGGDTQHGLRRAAYTAFGSIWICWSLAYLVVGWEDAFVVCFAARPPMLPPGAAAAGCADFGGRVRRCPHCLPTRPSAGWLAPSWERSRCAPCSVRHPSASSLRLVPGASPATCSSRW
jgi:phosphatidate cytidylyltransferase